MVRPFRVWLPLSLVVAQSLMGQATSRIPHILPGSDCEPQDGFGCSSWAPHGMNPHMSPLLPSISFFSPQNKQSDYLPLPRACLPG